MNKLHANGRNNSQNYWDYNAGSCWYLQQQHLTGCANGSNIWHLTMNYWTNVGRCWPTMLRSFARGFILAGKHFSRAWRGFWLVHLLCMSAMIGQFKFFVSSGFTKDLRGSAAQKVWKLNFIQGYPTTIFGKISVGKTIWDLEFSEHLLENFLLACLS